MRVLVVGAGVLGSLRGRVVRESPIAELCGVVDTDPELAAEFGARQRVAAFTDLAAAMDDTEPDVAVVATPGSRHREPSEILIEAGTAVLVESPLATTVEDAEAIAWLAEKRGVRLMTGHTMRFLPRYTNVLEAVRSDVIGEPLLITTSTWGSKEIGADSLHPTDPLWQAGIEDIDLIQWLGAGVINEVDGAHLVHSNSGVSTFAAMGALDNDVAFNMVTGWSLPAGTPRRWDLKVHGRRGMVEAAWSDDGVTRYVYGETHQPDCTLWPTVYARIEGAFRAELDHFLRAVADDTPFVLSPEEAVHAVLGTAILEAAVIIRNVD